MDDKSEKMGFFARIKQMFAGGSKANKTRIINTRFQAFVDALDKNDENYENAQIAASYSDEGLTVCAQRLTIIKQLNDINDELKRHEAISLMTEDETLYLKDLLARFISLSKERNALRLRLTGFDVNVTHIGELMEQAEDAMPQIKHAETHQQVYRNDVALLEGERESLEEEQQKLHFAFDFLGKFTMGLIFAFGAIAIYMVYLFVFQGVNVFFPLSIITVLVVIAYVFIYAARRKMRFEIAMNAKKQNMAVELMTKKTVMFAHYTNFLSFAYRKYGIKSADMLHKHMRDYENYSKLTARLDSIRSISEQTEAEIMRFLHEKSIENTFTTVELFARGTDIDKRRETHEDLTRQKLMYEKQLVELDAKHEELWKKLTALKDLDTSESLIVTRIIRAYMDETVALIERFKTTAAEERQTEEQQAADTASAETPSEPVKTEPIPLRVKRIAK